MMKNILLIAAAILLIACSADDGSVTTQEVSLVINHYKTTSVLNGTAFLIQEDEEIGGATFKATPIIRNLNYEPGFTYEVTAEKTFTENPGTDATTVSYEVRQLIEKEPVPPEVSFTLPLGEFVNGAGYVRLAQGFNGTFYLGGEIPLNCQSFCQELAIAFNNEEQVSGTFTHGEDGTYVLEELY
jgi:hypothetical protein